MASLFGISDGAARTCLWRMVSNGELTGDDGIYALAGPLLERRQRVDEAARFDDTALRVGWHMGIGGRLAGPPIGGRSARAAQGRDGAAPRRATRRCLDSPGQPGPVRLPTLRAVLDRQCVHFHGAATDIPAETVRSLFNLDDWAADARRLTVAMRDELDVEAVDATISPISSRCPSPSSDIFSSTHCCQSNSSRAMAGTRPAQHLPPLRRGVQAAQLRVDGNVS